MMWIMLKKDQTDDYVVATGETHSVREFVELAAKELGMEIEWSGEGVNEIGTDKGTGNVVVKIDEKYFRPAEVDLLLGDPTKAKNQLGWVPKYSFQDLVKEMVAFDLENETTNKYTF